MDDRRGPARQAGLLLAAFVGTIVVLAGLALLLGRPPDRGPASGPVSASASAAAGSPSPAVASVLPSATPTAAGSSPPAVPASPAPSPSGDPVLVGAGDIADCTTDTDSATAALLDGIAGTVFTAGDNAYYDGSAANFRDCYGPTWGRHRERTRPAAGNHDHRTRGAAGYLDYFGPAATNSDGDPWYSYDLGSWHVIVLDSECDRVGGCGPDSDQGRWLANDLATTADNACTLAIWHKPRFTSGEHGNDPSVDPFWRALHAAGADVVVNGHDHDYERFAAQDPDGRADPERGLRQFVVGTGGTALRAFRTVEPNSELRASVVHGVLALTLRPTSFGWQFVPAGTTFSDRGDAACH